MSPVCKALQCRTELTKAYDEQMHALYSVLPIIAFVVCIPDFGSHPIPPARPPPARAHAHSRVYAHIPAAALTAAERRLQR